MSAYTDNYSWGKRKSKKPVISVDFDGVLHAFTTPYNGDPTSIPDRAVPGAMQFLFAAAQHFEIHIHSGRSYDPIAIEAMREYIRVQWIAYHGRLMSEFYDLVWADAKPNARVHLDDRAIQFNGIFPTIKALLDFRPWNKRKDEPEVDK